MAVGGHGQARVKCTVRGLRAPTRGLDCARVGVSGSVSLEGDQLSLGFNFIWMNVDECRSVSEFDGGLMIWVFDWEIGVV